MIVDTYPCSDLAIPPGEYLEEAIAELGISKDELARCMNRPAAKLSAIYKGDKAITPETALQLEKVVGVPAYLWIGLEAEYRLILARQEEANKDLHSEIKLVTRFCYRELVRFGLVCFMKSDTFYCMVIRWCLLKGTMNIVHNINMKMKQIALPQKHSSLMMNISHS